MPKDAQEARAFKLAIIAGAVEAMAAAGAPRSDMVWHFAMMVQVGAQQMGTTVCFAFKGTYCRRKPGGAVCATLWDFSLWSHHLRSKLEAASITVPVTGQFRQ